MGDTPFIDFTKTHVGLQIMGATDAAPQNSYARLKAAERVLCGRRTTG